MLLADIKSEGNLELNERNRAPMTYTNVFQTLDSGPVPGPAINYTGP